MSYFRNPETGKLNGKRASGAVIAVLAGTVLGSAVANQTIKSISDESAKRAFSKQYIVENNCFKSTPYDPKNANLSIQGLESGQRLLNVTPTDGVNPMIHFLILGSFRPELTPADQQVTMHSLIANNCPIPQFAG